MVGRGRPKKNPPKEEQEAQKQEQQNAAKRKKVSESDEDETSEEEEDDEAEVEVEAPPSRGRPKKRIAHQPPIQPPTMHQTYVMKLYDRSLDLARFKEDDPLYIICRDWCKNNPRAKRIKPEPPEEPLPRKSVPEILTMIRNGINADIKFLPEINKIPGMKRCPSLLSIQKNPNKDKINLKYDLDEPLFDKDDLMKENLIRWKKIREHWQDHIKKYDVQYAESFEILDGIFRP